jgi:hypothetical protein
MPLERDGNGDERLYVVPLMDRLTPEQREHFRAQMALMRRRFDETHRQPTGVEYGTWPVLGAPFDEPHCEEVRNALRR